MLKWRFPSILWPYARRSSALFSQYCSADVVPGLVSGNGDGHPLALAAVKAISLG
jgi:hypothetical protein